MERAEGLYDITNHQHAHVSRHQSTLSDDSGCDLMDDSLTDMQWLQRMDAGADFPGLKHARYRKRGRIPSNGDPHPKPKDGCRKKLDYTTKQGSNKPPLSYASMISLAICSTPQRMMTLSSIYRWMESTFPFYRTPEAKAWKNSIRHNLSIRKNMFMKVHQFPPRRGNGSYWTLLSDGEEELQRAIPLFSTLHPPVIDDTSIYSRVPGTHVVKSKGQFVPVLPSVDSCGSHPYFSVGATVTVDTAEEVERSELTQRREARRKRGSARSTTPGHLLDHSYAKSLPSPDVEEGGEGTIYAFGHIENVSPNRFADSWDQDESSFEVPSTPKRKKTSSISVHRPLHERNTNPVPRFHSTATKSSKNSHAADNVQVRACTTPIPFSRDHDNSLNLLNSSFLTPMKNLIPDLEINSLSLSPLYNFVTPKRGSTPANARLILPTPFSPLKPYAPTEVDSGVFSPLRMDQLKFSTPLRNLSPLTDLLPPNTFSTPQDMTLPSLKVFDTSLGLGNTPLRPGSLQALGLPGLTPPGPSIAARRR